MTSPVADQGDLEFEQPLEEEFDQVVAPGDRRIYTDQADPEVDSLHGKYKRGKLVIQPDFQRQFVWDEKRSSRLIESTLLEIPLPVVYLSEDPDGKESVIDGQQRLTALFSFIDGQFPNGRPFKLTGLKVFTELNKKAFKDLEDQLQDKIKYCKIRTITFRKESQRELRFEVFERLNSGSVALNDQELRNCIYRGPYNVLLRELSQDHEFMHLMGLDKPDRRMKDVELVLRFAAFQNATYLNYRPPMRRFLNEDMETHQHISKEKGAALREQFKKAVTIIKSLLGVHAFKRLYAGDATNPNGRWEPKKFNASLYDILMYSMAREDKNVVFHSLDAAREALLVLMTSDAEFIGAIELSTSSVQAVTKRFDKWRLALQSVIGVARTEPRLFSDALKKQLFDTNQTCALCGQKILILEDSAVDHIQQYWTGGQTIPENARLTHRFCNMARPRRD